MKGHRVKIDEVEKLKDERKVKGGFIKELKGQGQRLYRLFEDPGRMGSTFSFNERAHGLRFLSESFEVDTTKTSAVGLCAQNLTANQMSDVCSKSEVFSEKSDRRMSEFGKYLGDIFSLVVECML